jgi:hypothetical protein
MGKRSFWVRLANMLGVATAPLAFSPANAEVLSLRAFEARFVAEAERAYPGIRIERLGDGKLRVQRPDGEGGEVSLVRVHALYQGTPEELPTIIGNLVSNIAPRPPASSDDLLVLVRPSTYAEGDRGPRLARPLVGDLSILVAVDRPTAYSIAPASDLVAELKLDEEAIWGRALANTRARLSVQPGRFEGGQPGEISGLDGLASSLLALDEFWDTPQMTSKGPVVVAVFARDYLFFAPESDAPAVQRLRHAMEQSADDPNALTSSLIVRRDGRWHLFR